MSVSQKTHDRLLAIGIVASYIGLLEILGSLIMIGWLVGSGHDVSWLIIAAMAMIGISTSIGGMR
ncbi:MAG: hypothetical protein Q8O83_03165, partial [bacterium]|nr:hypothetical protein [bacterium]